MSFTFVLAVLSASSPTLGKTFRSPLMILGSLILLLTCTILIFCYKEYRQRVPLNYILLGGATLGEACLLAATAANLTVMSVYMAILATCLAVAGLFCGALYTSSTMDRDLLIRNMAKFFFVSLLIDVFCIILVFFFMNPKDKAVVAVISVIMLVVVSAYVMYALLFVIVPGIADKDDYILGALQLYLEIARLFFWLMKLLGEKKNG